MFAEYRKITASIAAALCVCFLLTGCGGKKDGSSAAESKFTSKNSSSSYDASQTQLSSDDFSPAVTTSAKAEGSETAKPVSSSVSSERSDSVTSEKTVTTSVKPDTTPERTTSESGSGTTSASSSVSESSSVKPEPELPVVAPDAIDYAKLIVGSIPEGDREIFYAIVNAIESFTETVEFRTGEATQEQVERCLLMSSLTVLESSYVSSRYVISVDGDGFVTKLTLGYTKTPEEHEAEKEKLAAVVKEIVEGCKATDKYGVALYLHDEIIKRCRYDSESENMLSAFGCLVDGKAVCEGYSKAFIMLCAEFGIECVPVIGTTLDSNGNAEPHMWNLANIDGVWYHFDLTWDDPITSIGDDFVKYDYFGISDNLIKADHEISEIPYFTYPKAYSENGGYFTRSRLAASSVKGALSILENEIFKASESGERFVRIQVSKDEEFDRLNEYLFTPDENGMKPIFEMLAKNSEKTSNEDFNPRRYSKLVSEEKNILTIVLNYE